jgi:uncharacterized protein (DUF2267 family)
MTEPRHAVSQLALTVLTRRAGAAADAESLAAAADRAYHDLAQVLAAVIGDIGVNALTDRAVHLLADDYPWLAPARDPEHATRPFVQIIGALKLQDPAEAAEAAAAVFAAFLGLLATFIGEPLATRLVRQAWPDAFSSANTEER